MQWDKFNRRRMLRSVAAFGVTGAVNISDLKRVVAANSRVKTPPISQTEFAAVDAALGKKGKYVEAKAVYTVPLPRNDLIVNIKGDRIPISFGFGGWLSIKKTLNGRGAVLMSDTVLLEEEVNPLISSAHASGLEISAIHNHFFYEEPRIFYMHVHGMGAPADLAHRYAAATKNTKLFPANQPPAGSPPERTAKDIFNLSALDKIVGHKGAVNAATYKYTVGRDDLSVLAMGAEMTTSIGLNSWAAFAGDPNAAHIAGDIAMLEAEVNAVIKSLRRNNLEVVALHILMLGDGPRIIFLHYYGRGAASILAQGFRAALNELGKNNARRH